MSGFHLVVGLGNPGPRYTDHRHNVGFLVLDELAHRRGLAFTAGDGAWVVAGEPTGGLVLLRPLTFMNLSGKAVTGWALGAGLIVSGAPAAVEPEEAAAPDPVRPIVVCDDLALPLGSVRLRAHGSSGGQNGLESVIEEMGGSEFPRLRLGIAPLGQAVEPADWPDFVLSPFGEDEVEAAREMVQHAADSLDCWLAEGFESASSRFNRRVRPATDDV